MKIVIYVTYHVIYYICRKSNEASIESQDTILDSLVYLHVKFIWLKNKREERVHRSVHSKEPIQSENGFYRRPKESSNSWELQRGPKLTECREGIRIMENKDWNICYKSQR